MTADLKFHPFADLVPSMRDSEYEDLKADIKANGLLMPIVLFEGKVLDGRHRLRACRAVDVEPRFTEGTDWIGDPAGFVLSANLHRRHLTAEQKREIIAKVIAAKPEVSDRQIAKQVKADHKTVGAVRKAKEATGEVSPVDKRVGADGKTRTQPAKKARPAAKAKAKATLPKHDSRIISPELADRVGRFAHDLILSERLLARELADIIMLPGVRERLSADLTNGLALDAGVDAGPLRRRL
jgi:ParB-like nuclease domain